MAPRDALRQDRQPDPDRVQQAQAALLAHVQTGQHLGGADGLAHLDDLPGVSEAEGAVVVELHPKR